MADEIDSRASITRKRPRALFLFQSQPVEQNIYLTTYRAIALYAVIDFFIASGMMRSLSSLSRRLQSYYVRIFSPGAAFALWAFVVYDLYRGFKYFGSLVVISSTIADLASGDG
ncbi:hypothetical protein AB8989_01165 [Yersinia hibernica]|uniref:hypothetical protein n=1 Tax=Yersinia hibernica TaxID=2339259 RepID=UPI001FEAA4E1|nr:hypothetical protein [Yersinia hibernica]